MRISFGACILDTDQRQLTRDGAVVRLSPKAFRLLELLVQSRPRVVGRAVLHDALWPRTFVARTNLSSLVAEVRAAVGDKARRPRLIRTVHTVGYAFVGPVTDLATSPAPVDTARPSFRLILEDREVGLVQGENLLGRTEEARVWLDDANVSRRHARIVISGPTATLEDLESKNGTYLGHTRVRSPTELRDSEVIWVGPFSMTFRRYVSTQSTRTAVEPTALPSPAQRRADATSPSSERKVSGPDVTD